MEALKVSINTAVERRGDVNVLSKIVFLLPRILVHDLSILTPIATGSGVGFFSNRIKSLSEICVPLFILATCVLAIVVATSEARLGQGRRYCCMAMTPACLKCQMGQYDAMEENVGGGRVYGEYNKGPYKAGAEYNWDEEEENVGGGSGEAEYYYAAGGFHRL